METPIQAEHKPVLARLQHVGEYLTGERLRLETELRHVMSQAAKLDAEVIALLQRGYGIDAAHVPASLDVERGVIVTPDTPAKGGADGDSLQNP